VSGLTAGALAVVTTLAMQAGGAPVKTPEASSGSSPKPAPSHPHTTPPPPPVPANSGTGKRIVYSLSQQRVWVVPPDNGPVATFTVQPGTVPAKPGRHYVTGHYPQRTGSDGVAIEHVVFFEYTAETWIAFSAPVDDKVTKPDPSLHTGAIRVHRADETKIWNNTVDGSTVFVLR